MDIRVKVDDKRAIEAFQRAPETMRRHIGGGVERGALEVTRVARDKAPKLFSTLVNSINASRLDELHWQVRPGVNYAREVEEGTGPAAGRPRYYPNPDSLQQYIQYSPKMRGHKWAKAGTMKRGVQELDIWFRSRALAWYIYNHGTKAQPFMAPAAKESESRVVALIRESAHRGALEVMR